MFGYTETFTDLIDGVMCIHCVFKSKDTFAGFQF